MSAPAEIPYLMAAEASEDCRKLVLGLIAALGKPHNDGTEHQDRLLALIIVLAGEIARGGDHEQARARFLEVGKALAELAPQCADWARHIRESDKSKN